MLTWPSLADTCKGVHPSLFVQLMQWEAVDSSSRYNIFSVYNLSPISTINHRDLAKSFSRVLCGAGFILTTDWISDSSSLTFSSSWKAPFSFYSSSTSSSSSWSSMFLLIVGCFLLDNGCNCWILCCWLCFLWENKFVIF